MSNIYVILRHDMHQPGIDAIAAPKVVPSLKEAEAEVDRLNKLNSEKGCLYFWRATRWGDSSPHP